MGELFRNQLREASADEVLHHASLLLAHDGMSGRKCSQYDHPKSVRLLRIHERLAAEFFYISTNNNTVVRSTQNKRVAEPCRAIQKRHFLAEPLVRSRFWNSREVSTHFSHRHRCEIALMTEINTSSRHELTISNMRIATSKS